MTVKQELAKKAGNLREKDTKENMRQEMKTEDSVLQGRKDFRREDSPCSACCVQMRLSAGSGR